MQKETTVIFALLAVWCLEVVVVRGQGPACNATSQCTSGAQCMAYTPCQQGNCQCSTGYKRDYTIAKYTCLSPSRKVGDNCTKTTDCLGDNSQCTGGVCSCPSNKFPNSDLTDCVPLTLGTNCITLPGNVNPCGENGVCDSTTSVCKCKLGYKPYDTTKCIPLSGGDACANDTCSAGCPDTQATCTSGVYACNTGYTWVSSNVPSVPYLVGACVPNNATTELGAGQLCDWQPPRYRVCSSSFVCGPACPELNGASSCVGSQLELIGAGQTTASVTQGTHQNSTTTTHKTNVNSTQQLLVTTWLNLLMFAVFFSSIQLRS